MKSRHIQFIALGGSIGTGIFLGIGIALANAGPLSLFLGYFFTGCAVFCLVRVSTLHTRHTIEPSHSNIVDGMPRRNDCMAAASRCYPSPLHSLCGRSYGFRCRMEREYFPQETICVLNIEALRQYRIGTPPLSPSARRFPLHPSLSDSGTTTPVRRFG